MCLVVTVVFLSRVPGYVRAVVQRLHLCARELGGWQQCSSASHYGSAP